MSRSRRLIVLLACLGGRRSAPDWHSPGGGGRGHRPRVPAPRLGPQVAHALLASDTPQPKTVTASYSCDFSKYGTGISPATVSAAFEVSTPWPVNIADEVALATGTIALPSQVSSQLTGVDSVSVAASVPAQHAKTATVAISGAVTVSTSSAPTEIPQLVAAGEVTFPAKGTGVVGLPAQTITITPMAGTSAKPAITCTTTATVQDISIAVGAASGPFYACVGTIPGGGTGGTVDINDLFGMTVTASGTKQAGKSVTVTLDSDPVAAVIVALATAFGQVGVAPTKATFTSSLAVTGAQSGTLTMPATVTDLTATSFSASGKLKLATAGKVKIDIPGKWSLHLFKDTTRLFDLACTLVTKPAPVALTVAVAAASSPSATPTTTAPGNGGEGDDSSATPAATGTPSGGAATGGGPAPGGDAPLAVGGAALLLAGGGLVLRGVAPGRRRRRAESGARRATFIGATFRRRRS